MHYTREQRTGSIHLKEHIPSYESLHNTLREILGRANTFQCAHCDESAEEWAYNHESKDPIESVRNNCLVVYSLNPFDYIPLCRSCHIVFDIAMKGEIPRESKKWYLVAKNKKGYL